VTRGSFPKPVPHDVAPSPGHSEVPPVPVSHPLHRQGGPQRRACRGGCRPSAWRRGDLPGHPWDTSVCHRSAYPPEASEGHTPRFWLCSGAVRLLALPLSDDKSLRLLGGGTISPPQTGRGPRHHRPPGRRATGPSGARGSSHRGRCPHGGRRRPARPDAGAGRGHQRWHRRHVSPQSGLAQTRSPRHRPGQWAPRSSPVALGSALSNTGAAPRLARIGPGRQGAHRTPPASRAGTPSAGQRRAPPPVVDALPLLRGVHCTVAVTTVAAIGDLTRFNTPRARMKFLGRLPSADSPASPTPTGTPPTALQAIRWKAQVRRCKRSRTRSARGKHAYQVVVASAREGVGCMWAMAKQVPVPPAVHKTDRACTHNSAGVHGPWEETPPRGEGPLDGVKRPTGILVPRERQAPDGRTDGGPHPRRAAGAPVVSSWLRLCQWTQDKQTSCRPQKSGAHLLTAEVIATPGLSRRWKRKRRRRGRWRQSAAPSMPLRAAPTAETGADHPATIAYNRTEQSRVQTQPRMGDTHPALHAGSRSRMRLTLVAWTPMSTLLITGDRACRRPGDRGLCARRR
jgi:hypothetical protein